MTEPATDTVRRLDPAPIVDRSSGRPSLIVSALGNWTSLGTNVLVGLLLTPIVITHLGTSGYGTWALIGSIVGYSGLLELGVASGVSRYVARYSAQRDYEALNATVSTALAFFATGALGLVVASFVFGPRLAAYFQIRAENVPAFYDGIRIMSVGAGVSMVGHVYRAVVVAHERFILRNVVGISATLLRAGLTVWTLGRGMGLVGVAIANLAADSLSLAVFPYVARDVVPALRPRARFVTWASLQSLFVYGVPAALAALAHTLRYDLDAFVVGRSINVDAVAIYAVAAALIRYFISGVNAATMVLGPRFAILQVTANAGSQSHLLLRSLWLSSSLASVVAIVLLLAGGPFLSYWVGPDFERSTLILWLLAVPVAVALGQDPSFQFLFATNQHRFLAMALLIEGCANVVLSVMLAGPLGLVGVALGTAIPLLINHLLVLPRYVCRVSGIPLPTYYLRLTPWLAPAALLLALLAMNRSPLLLTRLG